MIHPFCKNDYRKLSNTGWRKNSSFCVWEHYYLFAWTVDATMLVVLFMCSRNHGTKRFTYLAKIDCSSSAGSKNDKRVSAFMQILLHKDTYIMLHHICIKIYTCIYIWRDTLRNEIIREKLGHNKLYIGVVADGGIHNFSKRRQFQ